MYSTIESSHKKIMDKIFMIRDSLESLTVICKVIRELTTTHKRSAECAHLLDSIHLCLNLDLLATIESDYQLAVVAILTDYYTSNLRETINTRDYYRIITSENTSGKLDDAISRVNAQTATLYSVLKIVSTSKRLTQHEIEYDLDTVVKNISSAAAIEIPNLLEKRNYEVCKCGTRMTVIPELSELRCDTCLKTKKIIGAVFRDDQFYPQEGQKTKHGGYDTQRHYRFWIERLQALESKQFMDMDLRNIEYTIARDNYTRRELNCEIMREILKDPIVNATHLNDHAPLLVKMFGGLPPPQLDFQENRLAAIRFNKAMKLYDEVNPLGGNKPYYPYFIYKIFEEMFANDPEKLRILDYIHLQSRETVIKNDKYYELICALANPEDGLVYHPTDKK